MNLYLYARSGHNFGLENVRRAAVLYKKLEEFDPVMATADYRAASFAKEELGVKKGVGVDLIENLPHMMTKNDILIYDSDEPSETMAHHMKEFCSNLYKIGLEIPLDIVEDSFFSKVPTKREKCLFFADDDYEDQMMDLCKDQKKTDMALLMGHYFFMGHDEKLAPYFTDVFEDEEYESTIKESKFLLTSSVHAALESLAAGNYPVYFPRSKNYYAANVQLLEKYNIPFIEGKDLGELSSKFDEVIKSYPQTKEIKKIGFSKVYEEIKATFKKFEGVYQYETIID